MFTDSHRKLRNWISRVLTGKFMHLKLWKFFTNFQSALGHALVAAVVYQVIAVSAFVILGQQDIDFNTESPGMVRA